MTADYDRAVSNHVIELYEESGQLLGLLEMIPQADHLLIENIAIRPDRQGKGLGEKLLQHAESFARSLGVGEIRLYTNAAFATNLAFYAKRGYIEILREAVAPGAVAVHMSKPIGLSDMVEVSSSTRGQVRD